jgi:hypothetical protein
MTVSILSGEVRGRHEGERNIRDVSEGVRISRTTAGVNARLGLKTPPRVGTAEKLHSSDLGRRNLNRSVALVIAAFMRMPVAYHHG